MKGKRWVVVVVGLIGLIGLGRGELVQAQTPALEDIVGLWERTSAKNRSSDTTHRRIVAIEPDGHYSMLNIRKIGRHSVSCKDRHPNHYLQDRVRPRDNESGEGGVKSLTLQDQGRRMVEVIEYWSFWNKRRDSAFVQDTLTSRRLDSAEGQALQPLFANGFVTDQPISAHVSKPTGTLADLVGVWEGVIDPVPANQNNDIPLRRALIFFADSTFLTFSATKMSDGQTDVCSTGGDWKQGRRSGDSVFVDWRDGRKSTTLGLLLREQQIIILWWNKDKWIYKPTASFKQP